MVELSVYGYNCIPGRLDGEQHPVPEFVSLIFLRNEANVYAYE